jgi:type I restriction enzyme S subunit
MLKRLPKGWVRTTLEKVCLPISTVEPTDAFAEFTYFDIGGIDNERNRVAETKVITGYNAPSRARLVLQKGDILFSTVRTYLRNIARVDGDYHNPIGSTGFAVIRAAGGVSSEFLFYQVLSEEFLQPLNALQSGSSYPAVRSRDVFAQPIMLPPGREQELIARKLKAAIGSLNEADDASVRAKERLERYRSAVLDAAFSGELTREWREEPLNVERSRSDNGEALLSKILKNRREKWNGKSKSTEPVAATSTNLPAIPKSWTWATPDQLSAVGDNSICAGPFGTIFKARDFRPAGVPIIFLRHVTKGLYVTKSPRFMDKQKWKQLFQPYSVYGGELLVTKLGDPPGVCAVFPEGIGPAMLTPDVIKFAVQEHAAQPKFLMHYFNSETGRRFSTGVAFGTTRLRLTLQLFREMPVPLPPISEQKKIVAEVGTRLTAAERLEETLERQASRVKGAREKLLTEALSGRLVPQDPKDEPAAVLLEHIANSRVAEAQKPKDAVMKRSPSRTRQGQRPLIAVLEEQKKPITPEQLFSAAGFDPSKVDQFYRELVSLRDRLTVQKPKASDAHSWPQHAQVLLKLKRDDR